MLRTWIAGLMALSLGTFHVLAAPCPSYRIERLSKDDLSLAIEEMSGLVVRAEGLVHVQDSGNEPYLFLTSRDGTVLAQSRFADTVVDPEDLAEGPCPWGERCLIVADTGDNFGWREIRSLYAVDPTQLWGKTAPRSQKVNFTFPAKAKPDVEAIAVTPEGILLFSKESKRTQVFRLPLDIWTKSGTQVAEYVSELPYGSVSGAAASRDGERILLISWRGVNLLEKGVGAERSRFYPMRKRIPEQKMEQQEAIAFDLDDRSFVYTSERRRFHKFGWGIRAGVCETTSPAVRNAP